MHNQDGTIQRGLGKGLLFNVGSTNASFLLGTTELDMQHALIALVKPGMTIYDAGANVGYVSVLAAKLVGPHGKVICFEPLPDNVKWIEHNAKLNGFENIIQARSEAIGPADAKTRFKVPKEATRGMLVTSGFSKDDTEYVQEFDVIVRSIDSLRAEGAIPKPDIMKIDVEGVEVDAIRGAFATIRDERPLLIVECHGTNAAVEAVIREFGYHPVPVESDQSIADSHWNVHIAAAPADRPDLVQLVESLRAPVI